MSTFEDQNLLYFRLIVHLVVFLTVGVVICINLVET